MFGDCSLCCVSCFKTFRFLWAHLAESSSRTGNTCVLVLVTLLLGNFDWIECKQVNSR